MHNKGKIAFIKMGSFSHTNDSVFKLLTREFPDFQVEVIDIFSDLVKKKDLMNLIHCIKEYGIEVLLFRNNIIRSINRTPYIFNKVKKAISDRLANQKYTFTFQTQSIFDVSVPGTTHFMYTDHTHLANLYYPEFNKKNLYSNSWIECEKTIYHNATLNFTMSSNISKSIIEQYSCDPDKVICVYCGSNVEVSKDEILDNNRYSNLNILFVGVDWERKGGPILADAFKKVLNTYPNANLTIVGCTPQLNLPNCNVVGRAPLSDVKKYYKEASVFCLPTKLEPFGIVFLEAMAYKLPIVATNIGAIPDFIIEGKNGYLIRPNDTQQLAQKLIKLIGAPDKCKALGEYSHKLFWDKYTWDKTGERIRKNIERFL